MINPLKPRYRLILACALALSGCGAPTVEATRSITSYEVTGMPFNRAADVTVAAIRARTSGVSVERLPTPSQLPAQPGSLAVQDALAGTRLGALAGGAFVATCEGAAAIIRAQETTFAGYGEGTEYTACLWPHQRGTRLDVYASYTRQSGGASAASLGAQIASSALGSSAQFIDKTRDGIVTELRRADGTVVKVGER